MARERGAAKERPKSDPGPTGQEKGTDGPPRDLSKVPPQLREHAHEPGSNGGVHRGPDLKPRLFVPSLLLKAFTDPGELALPPASKRSGAAKRKRARAMHALTLNAAKAVQGIGLRAAEGDETACGHLIKVLGLTHETLQPTKSEAAKGGQGPILPQFNRPSQSAQPSPPASIAPPPLERPKLIGPDGTLYEEAE
jgi:hypothetical protein